MQRIRPANARICRWGVSSTVAPPGQPTTAGIYRIIMHLFQLTLLCQGSRDASRGIKRNSILCSVDTSFPTARPRIADLSGKLHAFRAANHRRLRGCDWVCPSFQPRLFGKMLASR